MAKWPERVQQVVETLAAGVAHDAPDEVRRATTRKIAEQCRYELGPNWGTKRADPGRPPSADVVCTSAPFEGWDWSVPGGVASYPDSMDLAGQVFIVVEPKDHIGVGPVVPKPDIPPVPSFDLAPLIARIETLEKAVLLLAEQASKPRRAVGRTGTNFYHSHPIDVEIING